MVLSIRRFSAAAYMPMLLWICHPAFREFMDMPVQETHRKGTIVNTVPQAVYRPPVIPGKAFFRYGKAFRVLAGIQLCRRQEPHRRDSK